MTIYPEGYTVFNVGETRKSLEAFIEKFLMFASNDPIKKRSPESWTMRISTKPTILICGHNKRDRRCGVLGPLLRAEFSAWDYRQATIDSNPGSLHPEIADMAQGENLLKRLRPSDVPPDRLGPLSRLPLVGLVSHIGGHAWAGNVIIYLPPDHRLEAGTISPLAGKGVWYGRVEPRHVEGIMNETIRKGTIIEELLRGVHSEIYAS